MLLLLFSKENIKKIAADSFLRFNALAIGVNLPVYWAAPEVRPRYLFIFTALLFTILISLYPEELELNSGRFKILRSFLLLLSGVAVIMPIVASIHPETRSVAYAWLKAVILLIPLAFLFIKSLKRRQGLVMNLVLVLLLVKMGYNWFVLPTWYTKKHVYQQTAETILATVGARPLAYLNTDTNFDGLSFYITAGREKIIPREKGAPQTGRFYIGDDVDYPGFQRKVFLSFDAKNKKNQVLVMFTKK